jgi:hypothetical protein
VTPGTPCDVDGKDLPPNSNPSAAECHEDRPWHPFEGRAHFELANFIFRRDEMPGGRIDELMDILAAIDQQGTPPFADHKELYSLIDAISPEEMWECISIQHADLEAGADSLVDGGDPSMPTWKQGTFNMWLRDPKALIQKQISSPALKDFINYSPCQVFGDSHQRVWTDFMTGNCAWEQCVSDLGS